MAVGFTRGLKAAPEQVQVVGVDANQYGLQRAETDFKYLVPWARESAYFDVLNDIIDGTGVDLVTVQLEAELAPISANRSLLNAPVFLPRHETILACDSKWDSYEKFVKAGVPVPCSILINSEADLKRAFDELGPTVWLRALTGTGGKGSLPASSFEEGRAWIDMWRGWGNFMAAELLSKETVSWESVWSNGKLVAAQLRKRLYWEFSNLTVSGVTGITGASETATEPGSQRVAHEAVMAIDPEPHGIMGVDLAFDRDGNPKVTEINAGRFMSGGVILFAQSGFNFPYVAAKTGMGETVDGSMKMTNPFPDGMVCVRGLDIEPVITTRSVINSTAQYMKNGLAAQHVRT